MNKYEQLLNEVKDELFSNAVVQEYFKLKNILDKDKNIKKLDKEMKYHQKLMCKNKGNDEVYIKEKKLYEDAKNKIENNPTWVNYNLVKEEVYSLLLEVKKLIN